MTISANLKIVAAHAELGLDLRDNGVVVCEKGAEEHQPTDILTP